MEGLGCGCDEGDVDPELCVVCSLRRTTVGMSIVLLRRGTSSGVPLLDTAGVCDADAVDVVLGDVCIALCTAVRN